MIISRIRYLWRWIKATLVLDSVTVKIPGLDIGSATIKVDKNQREAAWDLYVEIVTRISFQELADDEGYLREALDSLYTLFQNIRQILKDGGPSVAARKGDSSVGEIAIAVLNKKMRRFMAKWHRELSAHEDKLKAEAKADDRHIGQFEIEEAWDKRDQMREELRILQKEMENYVKELEKIAKVNLEV